MNEIWIDKIIRDKSKIKKCTTAKAQAKQTKRVIMRP